MGGDSVKYHVPQSVLCKIVVVVPACDDSEASSRGVAEERRKDRHKVSSSSSIVDCIMICVLVGLPQSGNLREGVQKRSALDPLNIWHLAASNNMKVVAAEPDD